MSRVAVIFEAKTPEDTLAVARQYGQVDHALHYVLNAVLEAYQQCGAPMRVLRVADGMECVGTMRKAHEQFRAIDIGANPLVLSQRLELASSINARFHRLSEGGTPIISYMPFEKERYDMTNFFHVEVARGARVRRNGTVGAGE